MTHWRGITAAIGLAGLLGACAPAPQGPPIVEVRGPSSPVVAEVAPAPAAAPSDDLSGPGIREVALDDGGESCDLATARGLVGSDASAAANYAFSGPVRVVGPSDTLSTDYVGSRVNLYTDGSGTITRVACG
jgi:hypothetical protein